MHHMVFEVQSLSNLMHTSPLMYGMEIVHVFFWTIPMYYHKHICHTCMPHLTTFTLTTAWITIKCVHTHLFTHCAYLHRHMFTRVELDSQHKIRSNSKAFVTMILFFQKSNRGVPHIYMDDGYHFT